MLKAVSQRDITSVVVLRLDPGQSEEQVRAEVQTQLNLARALEELGDAPGAIRRTERAEADARKLLRSQTSDPENQLLLARALSEKCRALSKTGDTAEATEASEQALDRLRALQKVGDLSSNLQESLEVLLCDSLVLKVDLVDVLVKPQEVIGLLTEAVAHGERAYQAQPRDPDVVDSYARSLEVFERVLFRFRRRSFVSANNSEVVKRTA